MKVKVECSECKRTEEVDLVSLIKIVVDCTVNDSIFGGFLCSTCNKAMDDEN